MSLEWCKWGENTGGGGCPGQSVMEQWSKSKYSIVFSWKVKISFVLKNFPDRIAVKMMGFLHLPPFTIPASDGQDTLAATASTTVRSRHTAQQTRAIMRTPTKKSLTYLTRLSTRSQWAAGMYNSVRCQTAVCCLYPFTTDARARAGMEVLNINVGVLGHVDSGKTSLVKALSTVLSTASLDKNPQVGAPSLSFSVSPVSIHLCGLPQHLTPVQLWLYLEMEI